MRERKSPQAARCQEKRMDVEEPGDKEASGVKSKGRGEQSEVCISRLASKKEEIRKRLPGRKKAQQVPRRWP